MQNNPERTHGGAGPHEKVPCMKRRVVLQLALKYVRKPKTKAKGILFVCPRELQENLRVVIAVHGLFQKWLHRHLQNHLNSSDFPSVYDSFDAIP